MTVRCSDLDLFFDGELDADPAAAFRDHLVTCERCRAVLHGRIQEAVIAQASRGEPGEVAPAAAAADASSPAAHAATARAAATAPHVVADHAPRARRGRRRVLVYLAPVLAAAAALPLLWPGKRDDGPLELATDVEHTGPAARGSTHVGDVLRSTVRGERHRALWVYLDDRDLVAACPNDERCTQRDDRITLRLPLALPGRYAVVALGSQQAIPPPASGKTLDELLAAKPVNIQSDVRYVDVD